MDHQEYGDHAALRDAEWRSRVRAAARADVRAMLRVTRRRRLERWLVTATVLIAVVAVLMLLVGIGLFDRSADEAPAQGAEQSREAPAVAVDLDRPFAGTPAADWAEGAQGIVVPEPMQIGEYERDEVAAALERVRDALVAGRLDHRMLVEHDPGGYLDLLAEDSRAKLVPLFGTGREPAAQALVSLVADEATLLPVEPRVTGRMWAEAGGPGELVVHTNFLFAYAFDPGERVVADPMDLIVVVRSQVDYVLRTGERWTTGSQGLWYGYVAGFGYSIACDWYKKGFLAPAYLDKSVTRLPSARPDRTTYFDPEAEIPHESGCSS